MYKLLSALRIYFVCILFIVGWWLIAFHPQHSLTNAKVIVSQSLSYSETSQKHLKYHDIQRDILQKALTGDFALMTRLIADWDIDAQITQASGIKDIKRLPFQDFLRSQWIGRQLQYSSKSELNALKNAARISFIIDDAGKEIRLEKPFDRFLPQTYAAASFLLALTPPEDIVALPRLLREQLQLYPQTLTDRIPLDIDRYYAEKLFQAKPEIAFVAHYSHPSTIQTLINQGVVIYTMKNLTTLPDIARELINIGHLINCPLEAELLKIFIDAAFLAIDNKMLANQQLSNKSPRKVLFLQYHQNFSIPTLKTLTGQLLARMQTYDISLKYVLENGKEQQWMVPIDKERIINLNPDCLIIATQNKALEQEIYSDAALCNLSAIRNNRLYFVDEIIQQSPSQYVVLAYYDLIQTVIKSL